MDQHGLDHQTAIALTALAAALCKQPSLDGQKLRVDFLDVLEGLAQSPDAVETVGKSVAGLMDVMLKVPGRDIP
jgi:hypothetical protein